LTVTTSASVSRYGLVKLHLLGPCALLLAIALFSFVMWRARNVRIAPALLRAATRVAAIIALGLVMGGCGGYGTNTQPLGNRFNHGHCSVWSNFSHYNRKGTVQKKNPNERIISVRDLDKAAFRIDFLWNTNPRC
jgi:hypothetical protein